MDINEAHPNMGEAALRKNLNHHNIKATSELHPLYEGEGTEQAS
jgi:hypothetical protein